jgi:Asp-tRNA(Asn)/Glu-tRNA(Gln) amidotransferase C subunit
MENFTMVETRDTKKSAISIKPYFDRSVSNMGLEDYGLSLFDGVTHTEQLACLEKNGVIQYITGLNEFAPEIKLMKDKEEREAKVKQIRAIVAELEQELAANVLDIEDTHFWNNVKLLRPDNAEFWNKISLSCGNEPVFLDPKDPFDRIKLLQLKLEDFLL